MDMIDDDADWMDDEGYPTEAALRRLETWPYADVAGALNFIKTLWRYPDWVTHDLSAAEATVVHAEPGDRFLRLATAGWSGNESLVTALDANRMIRALAWRLDARGGLHIYQYPNDRGRYALRLDEKVHDKVGRVGGA